MRRVPEHHALPPVGPTVPQLTVRAVSTGMLLGGLLSLCNLYSGLKIGFTTNMSIATALLGFGLWRLTGRLFKSSQFDLHENLISQTAGSAAASDHPSRGPRTASEPRIAHRPDTTSPMR